MTLQFYSANSNDQLQRQFHNSLVQVNEFLADVEQKIHDERQILDNMPPPGEPGLTDYDVTDIWWPTMPSITATTLGAPNFTIPAGYIGVPVLPKNVSMEPKYTDGESKLPDSLPGHEDIPEMPDYVEHPSQPASPAPRQGLATEPGTGAPAATDAPDAPWSHPMQGTTASATAGTARTTDLIFGDVPMIKKTTVDEFLAALDAELERERAGYGTVYLIKLFEGVARKPRHDVEVVFRNLEPIVVDMAERGKLISLGQPLGRHVELLSQQIPTMPGDVIKTEAVMFHSLLKNRHVMLAPDTRAVLDYIDTLLSEEQGERLFRSLETFQHFPGGGKGGRQVCREMVDALTEPYFDLGPSTQRRRLVDSLNQLLHSRMLDKHVGRRRHPPTAYTTSHREATRNYDNYIRRVPNEKRTEQTYKRDSQRHRPQRDRHGHSYEHRLQRSKTKQSLGTKRQYTRTIEHERKQTNVQKRFNIINAPNRIDPFRNTDKPAMDATGYERGPQFRRGLNDRRLTDVSLSDIRKLSGVKWRTGSEEERKLRVSLYDVMYHGNNTFEMRNNNASVLASSSGTDHEVVLKSNIYKYFGYDPALEAPDLSF